MTDARVWLARVTVCPRNANGSFKDGNYSEPRMHKIHGTHSKMLPLNVSILVSYHSFKHSFMWGGVTPVWESCQARDHRALETTERAFGDFASNFVANKVGRHFFWATRNLFNYEYHRMLPHSLVEYCRCVIRQHFLRMRLFWTSENPLMTIAWPKSYRVI